jgi:outer membrane murein-binding lipoprotein Lpp
VISAFNLAADFAEASIEVDRLRARVEAMKADVERLSTELEAERSARRAAEEVARVAKIEAEALRQRFRKVGAELDELISNIGTPPRSFPVT